MLKRYIAVFFSVQADQITVRVTGLVKASACTTGISANKTIDLGQNIAITDLQIAGSATKEVQDSVIITDCPSSTNTATATFSGNMSTENSNLWANGTGEGYASNVQLELRNRLNGNAYIIADSQMTAKVENGQAIFPLAAKVVSTKGKATGGVVQSVLTMNLTYN